MKKLGLCSWKKLGHDRQLSQEEKRIVVDAARECASLPLGIVTLAESLKGVHELHKWKITLKTLKESNFWDMEDQIFQMIQQNSVSYIVHYLMNLKRLKGGS